MVGNMMEGFGQSKVGCIMVPEIRVKGGVGKGDKPMSMVTALSWPDPTSWEQVSYTASILQSPCKSLTDECMSFLEDV